MKDCASSASVSKGSRRAASCEASIAPWASPAAERRWLSSRKRSERNSTAASNTSAPTRKPAEIVNTTRLKIYSPRMRISTSSPEYKLSGRGREREQTRKKTGPRGGPPPKASCPVSYRTILRARRPPATSSTPAPSAIALGTETPPVGGSAEAEALAEAEAEAVDVAVAVEVAVEIAVLTAEAAEAVLTLMSRPAATLWKQASTWFWLTPSSWATALKSSASAFWYCPIAAWIWSQSTYWTLPATAVWAKAGAAAASTIASIAANSITFLNLIPSSSRIPL